MDNYLQQKSVTPMDFVRAFWHLWMTGLRLTNAYRYDHIMSKKRFYYEYERMKGAVNLAKKDDEEKNLKYLKFVQTLVEYFGYDL